VAQEVGVGGDTAYQELSEVLATPCTVCEKERASRLPSGSTADNSPAKIISAWLAPMLADSVGETGSGQSGNLAKQAQRT
jgi:hypothetical protein